MDTNKESSNFDSLVCSIRQVHAELAAEAGQAVIFSLTLRNGLIGRHIAVYEMSGEERAA